MMNLFLLLCLITQVLSRSRDPLQPNGARRISGSEDLEQGWKEYNFTQKLDHFGPNTRTYNQRYWISDIYWKPQPNLQKPVVLYMCGEWTCSPPGYDGAVWVAAKQLEARMVVLEHRFFGRSQPFSTEEGGWSHKNYQWLNTTYALADTAAFIEAVNTTMGANATDMWIVVGGSYPGGMVAWFRHLYPNHAKAAWSSSGVVLAKEDFLDFDMDIYLSTLKSGRSCPIKFAMITADIQRILTYGDAAAKAKIFQIFHNDNPSMETQDFMWYLSDIFTYSVQYGNRTDICTLLETKEFWESPYAHLWDFNVKSRNIYPDQYDATKLANTTVDWQKSDRGWTWQYCSEFGWFQPPNPYYPTRSLLMDHEFWIGFCKRVFSLSYAGPAVERSNSYYGGLDITTSNILYTNAVEDPWQYVGQRYLPTKTRQESQWAHYTVCTDCAHCSDLHAANPADSLEMKDLRIAIVQKLSEWVWGNNEDQIEAVKERVQKYYDDVYDKYELLQ